jgi:hypothetical protein
VLVDQIAVAQRELAQQKHQNSLLKEETAHLQSELELLQVFLRFVFNYFDFHFFFT